MDDREFPEEQVEAVLSEVDWEGFLDSLQADDCLEGLFFPSSETPPPPVDNSTPSWIGEIEGLLMKDDDFPVSNNDHLDISDPTNQQICDNFMADILVADSPSSEVLDSAGSQSGSPLQESEKDKLPDDPSSHPNKDSPDDPFDKKRVRQLRNRDAAVRSRERKKMYVKDLEMKTKYLEAEVRRLGRLLQCTVAENQALRFTVYNKGAAFGASSATKQESAVLLLESLLLGSLLWLVGIICLFPSPTFPQATPTRLAKENEGEKVVESVGTRGARTKGYTSPVVQTFVNSRRCKASRTRMRLRFIFLHVLV